MTSRVISSDNDRDTFIDLLNARRLPYTVTVKEGRHRSVEQNRLQRLWMNEASEQLGEYTPEEHRAYCKAWFGLPILIEDEDFRQAYDETLRDLTYEQKIKIMATPIDFPVTRLMTTKQKKRYLDDVYVYFTSQGVKLTEPDCET